MLPLSSSRNASDARSTWGPTVLVARQWRRPLRSLEVSSGRDVPDPGGIFDTGV